MDAAATGRGRAARDELMLLEQKGYGCVSRPRSPTDWIAYHTLEVPQAGLRITQKKFHNATKNADGLDKGTPAEPSIASAGRA